MLILQKSFPIPIRVFLLAIFGSMGVAAVALPIVSIAKGDPLVTSIGFSLIWLWNVFWFAWKSPISIEIAVNGGFTFVSALGHRTVVGSGSIRSVRMSMLGVPVVRHDHGRVWLLPTAPIAELANYMRTARPDVELDLPRFRPGGPTGMGR